MTARWNHAQRQPGGSRHGRPALHGDPELGGDLELDLRLFYAQADGTAALRDALDTAQGLAAIRALANGRCKPGPGGGSTGGEQARSLTASRSPPAEPDRGQQIATHPQQWKGPTS